MEKILKEWEAELRLNGFRITHPFRDVMEVIISSPKPLSPMEIFSKVRDHNPQIGLVTVYRSIEKLEQLDLLDHIHHINECQTVFPSAKAHKHLIICEKCGRSTYLDGLEIESEFKNISKEAGYEITGHWLQLSGLCEECQ